MRRQVGNPGVAASQVPRRATAQHGQPRFFQGVSGAGVRVRFGHARRSRGGKQVFEVKRQLVNRRLRQLDAGSSAVLPHQSAPVIERR